MYCQSQQRPSYRKINKRIIAHPVTLGVGGLSCCCEGSYVTRPLPCLPFLTLEGDEDIINNFVGPDLLN